LDRRRRRRRREVRALYSHTRVSHDLVALWWAIESPGLDHRRMVARITVWLDLIACGCAGLGSKGMGGVTFSEVWWFRVYLTLIGHVW